MLFTVVQVLLTGVVYGQNRGSTTTSTSATSESGSGSDQCYERCKDTAPSSDDEYSCLFRCKPDLRGLENHPAAQRKKSCDKAKEEFNKKQEEFSSSCSAARAGADDCKSFVKDCYESASNQDYEDQQEYVNQFMNQFGVSREELDKKRCPGMTFKDWTSNRKEVTDSLKSSKEKLNDAQKEMDKLGAEQNKGFEELNKEALDLIKNQKRQIIETKQAKREALLKRQDDLRKAQQSVSDLENRVREKSAEITAMHYDKATKLATASDAIAKFNCSMELEKKLKDMPKVKAGSFNSLSRSGGSSFNSKNLSLAACVNAFQIGRKKEIELFNRKIESAQKLLAALEEDLKLAKDGIEAAKTAQDEAMQDLNQADKDALEDHNARLADIQKRLSNLSADTNNRSRTLVKRIQDLTQEVTRDTNELGLLKAEKPKSGATETYEDAEKKYRAAGLAHQALLEACGKSCSDSFLGNPDFCKDGKPNYENLRGSSGRSSK